MYKRSSLWHTGPSGTCACSPVLAPPIPAACAPQWSSWEGWRDSWACYSLPYIPFQSHLHADKLALGEQHQVLKSLALAAGPSGQLETPQCPWPLSEGERVFWSPPCFRFCLIHSPRWEGERLTEGEEAKTCLLFPQQGHMCLPHLTRADC